FLHRSIILTARAIESATDVYPHSLSYQETSLTKLSFRAIPALASKMLDLNGKQHLLSPWKSVETRSSST
ncbi:uncharacterized protein, partial [Aegilops tauschii subsp. strangulata]|uniref:uncharacterized protein n=1 Tax=Aegilops tauschii subsp. strangulata TaxID=200361 RepID=UPI001ABC85FF